MDGKLKALVVMGLAIVAVSIGEALASKGMKEIDGTNARDVLSNAHVLCGAALMLVYLGLFLAVLRLADLSLAVPLTAASFPLGAALSLFYLGEDVTLTRWIGTAVVTVGVLIAGIGDLASK